MYPKIFCVARAALLRFITLSLQLYNTDPVPARRGAAPLNAVPIQAAATILTTKFSTAVVLRSIPVGTAVLVRPAVPRFASVRSLNGAPGSKSAFRMARAPQVYKKKSSSDGTVSG